MLAHVCKIADDRKSMNLKEGTAFIRLFALLSSYIIEKTLVGCDDPKQRRERGKERISLFGKGESNIIVIIGKRETDKSTYKGTEVNI